MTRAGRITKKKRVKNTFLFQTNLLTKHSLTNTVKQLLTWCGGEVLSSIPDRTNFGKVFQVDSELNVLGSAPRVDLLVVNYLV